MRNSLSLELISKHVLGFHITSPNFKLRELLILLIFYFHKLIQQLNTFFHSNFWFERVLRFATEDA